jgi:hypothetical protein
MADQFFQWYFSEIPAKIKKIWGNYFWFFSKYFALADIGREFLAPWKGLVFTREKRAFELGDMLSAWFGNIISRTLGAIMRSFFLAAGFGCEILTAVAGAVVYLAWAVLFILVPAMIVLGIWLMFA